MKKKEQSVVDQILVQSEEILAANQQKDLGRLKSVGTTLDVLLKKAYWEHPEVFYLPRVRAAKSVVSRLKRALYIQLRRSPEVSGGAWGQGGRR